MFPIPSRMVRDTEDTRIRRLAWALAVVPPVLALVQTLADAQDYWQPAAPVVAWLAVLGIAAWFVPRLRTDSLKAGETTVVIVIALAAVAVADAEYRARGLMLGVDLAILGTAWLLGILRLRCPAWVWIPSALLIFAVHGALLIGEQGLSLVSLSQLAAGGYIIAAALIAFAALGPTLDARVSVAARRTSLASRSAAERAAASAIKQERDSALAVLESEALPLLRGIADGTLDPADEGVMEQCARNAAVLRLALDGSPGGELMAELERVLRAAAYGLPATMQVIGDPGTPPQPIARAVLATVDAVLSALPPHQAVLTVLAVGDDIELYLSFSVPLRSVPDVTRFGHDLPAAACWRAALSAAETGEGFLEVSWRKDDAAEMHY